MIIIILHYFSIFGVCNYSCGESSPKSTGAALYPNLLDDYSVISLPSSDDLSIQKLLPFAEQLSTSLSKNISAVENIVLKSNKGNTIIL